MSFQFRQNMPNHIVFGNEIGKLSFDDDKLIFTGNADESAKILFDFVVAQFNSHIQKLIVDEREACAKIADDLERKQYEAIGDPRHPEFKSLIGNAIRARGEK